LDAWARLTVDCCGLVRAIERGRAWLVTVAKKRFFEELDQKGYTPTEQEYVQLLWALYAPPCSDAGHKDGRSVSRSS
jgi:hypothetical protein